MNREVMWLAAGVLLAILVVATLIAFPGGGPEERGLTPSHLNQTTGTQEGSKKFVVLERKGVLPSFRSWSDIFTLISSFNLKPTTQVPSYNYYEYRGSVTVMPATLTVTYTQVGAQSPQYSKTNVHVSDVDESDIVKTDGRNIYVVMSRSVVIAYRAYPPDNLSKLWELNACNYIKESNVTPTFTIVYSGHSSKISGTLDYCRVEGLYTINNKVIAIATAYYRLGALGYPGGLMPRTWVLEIGANGKVVNSFWADGAYVDSRLFDNRSLVLLTLRLVGEPTVLLTSQGVVRAEDVYLIGAPESFVTVSKIDLLSFNVSTIALLGSSANIVFMTHKYLYVVHSGWYYNVIRILSTGKAEVPVTSMIYTTSAKGEGPVTVVTVLSLNDLRPRASVKVNGNVRSQWQLNELGDNLVLVVDNSGMSRSVNLYVFSLPELKEVSSLNNIAIEEGIRAVRLLGDKLYLVTFRQVDPLFVIDLSDVREPKVIGFIEAPGFDTYLHPINSSMLVGVGFESGRIRVSLYKVLKNYSIEVVNRIYLGLRSWSPIMNARDGYKAFTYDPIHDYVLIPVMIEVPSRNVGVAVIKVNGNLSLIKVLNHQCALRSLYIDDVIYTVALCKYKPLIKAFNATTLSLISEE